MPQAKIEREQKSAATPQPEPENPIRFTPKPHGDTNNLFRILNTILTVGIVGLLISAVLLFANTKSGSEAQYVMKDKYQAVFLDNGQLYFGKVANLNSQYIVLDDAYYLTPSDGSSSSSDSSGNFSLVPVGCQQIQYPYNKIVINRSQVTFWENLQDAGRVVANIKTFEKQNPNGPDCSKTTTQTQPATTSDTSSDTNNSGTSNATTGGAQ